MTARMPAQHQRGPRHADVFRADDFVTAPVFEHSVLVDAGFMREGIASDDGLVGLHGFTGHLGQHPTGGEEFRRSHPGLERPPVGAHAGGHHHFLERCVPGTFADAVDGALHLSCAGAERRQRVGHGQAKVVVAVSTEDHAIGSGHAGHHVAEKRGEVIGCAVADGVG